MGVYEPNLMLLHSIRLIISNHPAQLHETTTRLGLHSQCTLLSPPSSLCSRPPRLLRVAESVQLLIKLDLLSPWPKGSIASHRLRTLTPTLDDGNRNCVLRGGNAQSACFTFGKDMPRVTCTEYARNGAPGEGCHGNLPVSSVRVGTGESCAFYSGEGCSRDTSIVNRVNDCVTFSGRNQVRSYKCASTRLRYGRR